MARAYGSGAALLLKRETAYGTQASGNYIRMPFNRCSLGSEQGLIDDPVLGYGRDPRAPLQDVINDEGDIVVPMDPRYLGFWLTGLLGDPATEAPDIHDEMCPDPPGLSNFRSGKLCVDANGDKSVCVEQVDVTVDGADRCGFDGRQVPCTWFGFEFDFLDADPVVPLVCAWERSVPGNMGNLDGIVERDTSSGVGSVLLPGADGHYVYANFQVHSTPPGAVPSQIISKFDCSYAGVALFDVEYRLNIVP